MSRIHIEEYVSSTLGLSKTHRFTKQRESFLHCDCWIEALKREKEGTAI